MEAIDVLDRAIAILEREMAKNPALVQVDTTSVKALLQSMSAVINAAASFSITDQKICWLWCNPLPRRPTRWPWGRQLRPSTRPTARAL